MEKTIRPDAHRKLGEKYWDAILVGNGDEVGIYNVKTGQLEGDILKYPSSYKVEEFDGIIAISDVNIGGSIRIYDARHRNMIADNLKITYAIKERNGRFYIAKERETDEWYLLDLEAISETRKLPEPYDHIDFLKQYSSNEVASIATRGDKKAILGRNSKATNFELESARVAGNAIICKVANTGREFFVNLDYAGKGEIEFKRSKRYDKIEATPADRYSDRKAVILTCKNKGTIDIYEVGETFKNLLFSMRCDGAEVTACHKKDNRIFQYELAYYKGDSIGLSTAIVDGSEVIKNVLVEAGSTKVELGMTRGKMIYKIGDQEVENLYGDAINEVILKTGEVVNLVELLGGKYFYIEKADGTYAIVQIDNGKIRTIESFSESCGTYFADNSHVSIVVSKNNEKRIISIDPEGVVISETFDQVQYLGQNSDRYFLVTKEGEKCVAVNSIRCRQFKCFDRNTGMENSEPKTDDMFLIDDKGCCTLVMGGRGRCIASENLSSLKGITFGEKSVVIKFDDVAWIFEYNSGYIHRFQNGNDITPKMVRINGEDQELYQDSKGNWWGTYGDSMYEFIEYIVPEAKEKETRKHLINQE